MRHENMLLTVHRSRIKEWRNKGTQEGRKHERLSQQPSVQHLYQHSANCVHRLKCYGFKASHRPWESFLYRVYRSEVVVLNHCWFCAPGDIWQHLGIFWVVTTGGVTGIHWIEVRNAAKYPMIHRIAPYFPNREFSTQKCQECWDWEIPI